MARASRENLLALGPGLDGHRVSDLETASYLCFLKTYCVHARTMSWGETQTLGS